MIILLTGATGFIGRRLSPALQAAGHTVIEARRRVATGSIAVAADFTRDLNETDWLPKLAGIDAVINAVGILRERGEQTFERVHTRAPQALFAACAVVGVNRVIQISALGADHGGSGYFVSKHAADETLSSLPLAWTIVQPSLVYGEGGISARLFTMLASLPIIPLPGRGAQGVQPIHIDDLVEAIVNLLGGEASTPELWTRRRVALVGPEPMSLREFLRRLRAALGLSRARFLPVPFWMMRMGASVAHLSPNSLLDRDTLDMLAMGNIADPSMTQRLLRRQPRNIDAFVSPESRSSTATAAQLSWLLPLVRFSIAAVWLWTGVVSLGLYPRESSYELLARTGAPAQLAPLLLYGAAAIDLLFGFATLLLRRRRALWLAQIAVILIYTAIVTVKLPEFWLHPYGPILKNLPMLAAIFLLYTLETRDPAA